MQIINYINAPFPSIESGVGNISLIVTFDWIVTQSWVRGQSGGSWGLQTQLDYSQVCSTCISHVYTCMHVKYTCIHVKYMCYTPGNGLVVFATPKNPHFDPSITSEWQFNQKLQLERCWAWNLINTNEIHMSANWK